jgi:RNA 2',3'-cyclic 3'-phosphodiesterase
VRLFFALWPGDAVRQQLADTAASIAARTGGRVVPAVNLHLTLAFLGEIAAELMPQALDAARSVRGTPFELVLDSTGSFRDARVAWAGLAAIPPALALLQGSLEAELRSRAFVLDDRPFAPHATLVRKIATSLPRESMAPIAWSVRDFVLVHSERGRGHYKVLECWNLEGQGTGR